jgi:hypothetical protein
MERKICIGVRRNVFLVQNILVLALEISVTRVRVRVSHTIRIRYVDTHFLKRNPTKMVYLSIRIRVYDEYRIRIRHPPWSIHVT